MKYDTSVYIGRFQPVHIGHLEVMREALKISNNLLVLVGSANLPRTPKNPWIYTERAEMIFNCLTEDEARRIRIKPLNDYTYNHQQWLREVQEKVTGAKVALVGHYKDDSSYYLKHFPMWDLVDLPLHGEIHSTDIREDYFDSFDPRITYDKVPKTVATFLEHYQYNSYYVDIKKEHNYNEKYKRIWSNTPYPVTFQTVDAVVIQSAHILLIQRKHLPGKGLWALPGGFIDPKETLRDACIRELREETKLKVPIPVLLGSIKKQRTYDHPERSSRGRTITQAYLIELDDSKGLPEVRGADDAAKAQWFPLSEFYKMSNVMYEDHYSIIRNLIDNE